MGIVGGKAKDEASTNGSKMGVREVQMMVASPKRVIFFLIMLCTRILDMNEHTQASMKN